MRNYSNYFLDFLKTLALSAFAFISPINGLLFLVGLFVFSDTFFAIYASIKLNGYSSYKSHKLFNIVVKSFFYLGSVFLAFLVDKFIINSNIIYGIDLLIAKSTSLFWIYIEMKSIDETSQKLGNKPFVEIIKNIIEKGKSLKADINEIKND